MFTIETVCGVGDCENERKHDHMCCDHFVVECGGTKCWHDPTYIEPHSRVLDIKTWTFRKG